MDASAHPNGTQDAPAKKRKAANMLKRGDRYRLTFYLDTNKDRVEKMPPAELNAEIERELGFPVTSDNVYTAARDTINKVRVRTDRDNGPSIKLRREMHDELAARDELIETLEQRLNEVTADLKALRTTFLPLATAVRILWRDHPVLAAKHTEVIIDLSATKPAAPAKT